MADKKETKKEEISLIPFLRQAGAEGTAVDLDQLKVRLLIICKEKSVLEQAAQFLNRRGWQVVTTTKVGQALKTITILKPDLVLMSVNIQSAKAQQLPTVIFHTFHTEVITFGEYGDTMTMKLMQTIQSNYKLQGTVSGTTIQRRIKQILQEVYKPETTAAVDAAKALDKNSGNEERAGAQKQKGAANELMRFESEKKEPAKGAGIIIAKGGTQNKKAGAAYSPTASESSQGDEELYDDNYVEDDLAEFEDAFKSAQNILAAEGDPSGASISSETKRDDAVEETVRSEERLDEILKDIQESHGETTAAAAQGDSVYSDRPQTKATEKPADVMYEGAVTLESTLRTAVIRATQKKETNYIPLVEATEGLAIPFLWSDKAGVVVVVQSGSAQDRISFENKFVEELRSLSSKVKIDVEVGRPVRVYFEASEIYTPNPNDAISFRVPNKSGEVCVTFSEHSNEEPEIIPLASGDKAQVKVSDIVEEVPVGVDLYVHLPRNGKYVKLIKAEGAMSLKQKQRLTEEKAHLYIEPQEADQFKRSIARNKAIARVKSFWKKARKAG